MVAYIILTLVALETVLRQTCQHGKRYSCRTLWFYTFFRAHFIVWISSIQTVYFTIRLKLREVIALKHLLVSLGHFNQKGEIVPYDFRVIICWYIKKIMLLFWFVSWDTYFKIILFWTYLFLVERCQIRKEERNMKGASETVGGH